MLVNQHPYRDTTHIEPVEEVLYPVLHVAVYAVPLLHLHDALRHGFHYIAVTVLDVYQSAGEAGKKD